MCGNEEELVGVPFVCLLGTGVIRHMLVPFVCLLGTGVIRHMLVIPLYIPEPFVSPARASRALAEAATSWTSPVCRLAGLYERPAPARVHERVRLP